MFRVILLLLCLSSLLAFPQKKADTLRLYFSINEIESAKNFSRIDSSLKSLNGKNVDIGIFGYADFLSNEDYNQTLSQKRADAVKKYLDSKAPPSQINIYASEGKGEKFSKANSSKDGEPKQRRVDVYFEPVVTLSVAESFLETPKDSLPKDSKKSIEELKAGESMIIEGLSFVPGRHVILQSAAPALQKLLKTMKDNPKLKIEIQGHVCCTGSGDGVDLDTREPKLSENRAKAIYDYLVDKGISKSRLSYKGFGRSKPKELIEDTPEKEQANRRVEILVLEK